MHSLPHPQEDMSLEKVRAQRKGDDTLPSKQRPLPIKKYSKKENQVCRDLILAMTVIVFEFKL